MMTKYARNKDGSWIDVFDADDASVLERRLGVTGFIQVDDAVKHGDIVVEPDGFISRPIPPLVFTAKVLSKTEFADHCYEQLGGGITGIDRFGAILKAAAASTNDGVYAALDRYKSANTIEKANASIFIALLQSDGILTQQEANNVINNWPVQ